MSNEPHPNRRNRTTNRSPMRLVDDTNDSLDEEDLALRELIDSMTVVKTIEKIDEEKHGERFARQPKQTSDK